MRRWWRRGDGGGRNGATTLRLYYASDVHGSELCWRKFLRAREHYGVDAIIMGGDLTGKAIVPVIERRDGSQVASLMGEERVARTDTEWDELAAAIRYNGMYPWAASQEEVAAHERDASAMDRLFERVMLEELDRWMRLGDPAVADDVLVIAGNDDPWAVDEVLRNAETVRFCDDRVVRIGEHELLSSSFANPTPWDSPRELDEESLYRRLRALADQLERPERAIFNLHVPPYDSGLDNAGEVDPETMTYVVRSGKVQDVPVGSHAVRQIIEEVQPVLSLHGHIHESRGMTRIGRTAAINSGSEYNSGTLHGVRVELAGDRVASSQLVVG